MTESHTRPGVIFDRDGVLNVDTGYVFRPEDLVWIEGARQTIVRLNQAGVAVLVATNQSGIGRGYFTEDQLHRFHEEMQAQLAEVGGRIDQFYFCPFHEDAVTESFRIADHPDRKPNPGMVLKALADWSLDPARCLMVGDRGSDVEAARRGGIRGLKFEGSGLQALIVDGVRGLGIEI